jgi:hypothetical protein
VRQSWLSRGEADLRYRDSIFDIRGIEGPSSVELVHGGAQDVLIMMSILDQR